MSKYKGITFGVGYKKSFEDFKKEFASTHVFKNIPEHQREAELKNAYEIATGKSSETISEASKPAK